MTQIHFRNGCPANYAKLTSFLGLHVFPCRKNGVGLYVQLVSQEILKWRSFDVPDPSALSSAVKKVRFETYYSNYMQHFSNSWPTKPHTYHEASFEMLSLLMRSCCSKHVWILSIIYQVIHKLFHDLEVKHGLHLVRHALGYVTALDAGLTEEELEHILSLDDEVSY